MSTKTSFKRIALAVIAALGFGLLTSMTPANAAINESTLTVSAPSATTAAHGETITVAVDVTFIATTANETVQVFANFTSNNAGLSDGTGFTNYRIQAVAADSVNVTSHDRNPTSQSGIGGENASTGETVVAVTANASSRAKFNVVLYKAVATTTDRVITGTVYTQDRTNTTLKSSSFTVTVSAFNTTATAANSKMWLNQASNPGTTPSEADSTLVVNRGTVGSYTAVGYIWPLMLNSADTKTVTGTSTPVGASDSITVTLTGPGALALSSAGKTEGAKLKSVTVGVGETVVVYNDGTSGVATIRGAIGSTFLTQAAKTVTFVGPATTITAKLETTTVTRGSIAYDVVSFTAADASGNAIITANQGTGYPGGFYAISSDSGVAGSSLTKGSSLRYTTCDYNSQRARWVCDLAAADSGTATIQIGDSLTVASSGVTSAALTLTVAGTGNTGTITLPKSTYNVGEKAIITVTSKDGIGQNVADGTSTPFSGLRWGSISPTFGQPTGSDASGGNAATNGLTSYLDGGGSYVSGVDTLVVYMPTATGTYTLIGVTGGATTESTVLTFTVVDPAQVANAAAIAAAQAASDAAADAAAEAIDAANAATDAANLAAEAADAATVAAEEARDAADAATAAVEELATQVATLMAALKAQITTLANTVAKIAKKVKA